MKTYLRILQFGRPFSRYALPYFVCILLHSIFNAATFGMLIPIINTMTDGESVAQMVTVMPDFEFSKAWADGFFNYATYKLFGESSVEDLFMTLAVMTVLISLLSNLFRYLSQRIMENLRIGAIEKIRNGVFNNVIHLQASYFTEQRKGAMISKITSDVQVVQFCITNTLQVLFREPLLIAAYMFLLISISWQLTIFVLAVLPVIAFFIGYIVKKLRRSATQGQESFAGLVSLLDESLGAIKTIKGYNASDYVDQKFVAQNKHYSDIQRDIAVKQQMASPMSEFLGITSLSFILVYGGNMIVGGELAVASFIAYLGAFSQVTRPARSISDAFGNINQGIAAGERVMALMDEVAEIKDRNDALVVEKFENGLAFENVSFSYDGEREILSNVSFEIPRGKTVALVGASGGGKSTISDLIPRFYDPLSGRITLDGRDTRDYTLDSLRSLMGIVAQETILFNDTIEGNIRLGNHTATREQVIQAAKVANAWEFISQMPEGLDTNIGDRGTKLSGGQRQRISIARAVLRNPDILILDEATSALDTQSERLVQESLTELLKGRTSLVIAHRLSTIQHSDNIIVIDRGGVAEQGTHEQLLSKGGIYSRLIEMQQLSR
ncbi:MAG: ABC transporter ATP-binding protein [Rikenellaceae bacterium]